MREIRERGYATEVQEFASTHAAAAFPVRREGRPVAAIAIEGPVLRFGKETSSLEQWMNVVRSLEKVVDSCPPTIEGLFAHLDPNDIVLATS